MLKINISPGGRVEALSVFISTCSWIILRPFPKGCHCFCPIQFSTSRKRFVRSEQLLHKTPKKHTRNNYCYIAFLFNKTSHLSPLQSQAVPEVDMYGLHIGVAVKYKTG